MRGLSQLVCPIDGQTLDWHLKSYVGTPGAHPKLFGDALGCGFISPMDRQAHEDRLKRERKDANGKR